MATGTTSTSIKHMIRGGKVMPGKNRGNMKKKKKNRGTRK